MKRRNLIILLVTVGALVTAIARKESAPRNWPENDDAKKLKFSHKYHVGEAGIDCEDCHK